MSGFARWAHWLPILERELDRTTQRWRLDCPFCGRRVGMRVRVGTPRFALTERGARRLVRRKTSDYHDAPVVTIIGSWGPLRLRRVDTWTCA